MSNPRGEMTEEMRRYRVRVSHCMDMAAEDAEVYEASNKARKRALNFARKANNRKGILSFDIGNIVEVEEYI